MLFNMSLLKISTITILKNRMKFKFTLHSPFSYLPLPCPSRQKKKKRGLLVLTTQFSYLPFQTSKNETKTLNPKMTLSYLREMSPCNLISSETSDSLTFIYPVFCLILCLVPYPAKPLALYYNLFLCKKILTFKTIQGFAHNILHFPPLSTAAVRWETEPANRPSRAHAG